MGNPDYYESPAVASADMNTNGSSVRHTFENKPGAL